MITEENEERDFDGELDPQFLTRFAPARLTMMEAAGEDTLTRTTRGSRDSTFRRLLRQSRTVPKPPKMTVPMSLETLLRRLGASLEALTCEKRGRKSADGVWCGARPKGGLRATALFRTPRRGMPQSEANESRKKLTYSLPSDLKQQVALAARLLGQDKRRFCICALEAFLATGADPLSSPVSGAAPPQRIFTLHEVPSDLWDRVETACRRKDGPRCTMARFTEAALIAALKSQGITPIFH